MSCEVFTYFQHHGECKWRSGFSAFTAIDTHGRLQNHAPKVDSDPFSGPTERCTASVNAILMRGIVKYRHFNVLLLRLWRLFFVF